MSNELSILQSPLAFMLRTKPQLDPVPISCSMKNAVSDTELIRQSVAGDESAFRRIVECYSDRIAAIATGMLGRGQDADDVGQETFIRLYQSLPKIRGESSLGTYLTRIAINLCVDVIRKKRRWRYWFWMDDSEEIPPPELTIEYGSAMERGERKEIVQRALQALDPKHRAVVVLRMIEGYSTKETAELLHVPVGTVLSRLSRAQERLRVILKPWVED